MIQYDPFVILDRNKVISLQHCNNKFWYCAQKACKKVYVWINSDNISQVMLTGKIHKESIAFLLLRTFLLYRLTSRTRDREPVRLHYCGNTFIDLPFCPQWRKSSNTKSAKFAFDKSLLFIIFTHKFALVNNCQFKFCAFITFWVVHNWIL